MRRNLQARNRTWMIWTGLLAGFLLLVLGNGHEDLWYDECYSVAMTRHPLADIAAITAGDSHPPLFYWMLRGFLRFIGAIVGIWDGVFAGGSAEAIAAASAWLGGDPSDMMLPRVFSAIAILLLAALALGPVKRLLGGRTALHYAVLVFLSPMAFAFGREVRMYAWAAFFVAGATLYGLLALRTGFKRWWAAFVLFGAAASLTHYYALLSVGVVGLLLLAETMRKPELRKRIRPLVFSGALILAAFFPWAFQMGSQVSRMPDYWITEVSFRLILQTLTYLFNRPFTEGWLHLLPVWLFSVWLVLLGAGWKWKRVRAEAVDGIEVQDGDDEAHSGNGEAHGCDSEAQRCEAEAPGSEDENPRKNARFFAVAYVAVFLASLLITLLVRPMLVPRYLFCTSGLWLLPMAHGLACIRPKRLHFGISLALLAFFAWQIIGMEMERINGPVRESTAELAALEDLADPILHVDGNTFGVFSVYLPGRAQMLYQPEGSRWYSNYDAFLPNGTHGSDAASFLSGHDRVWIAIRIDAAGKPVHAPDEALMALPADSAFTRRLPDSWFGVAFLHVEALALAQVLP